LSPQPQLALQFRNLLLGFGQLELAFRQLLPQALDLARLPIVLMLQPPLLQ
jgi:hypothetical protein